MNENPRLYGYDFHTRGPCAIINQRIAEPATFEADHADRWLSDHFSIPEERLSAMQAEQTTSEFPLAEALLRRALFVYCEILKAARIPAFDRGRILALLPDEQDSGILAATLALPTMDDFALEPLVRTFRSCLKLVGDVLSKDPREIETPKVLDSIDAQLVKKLDQSMLFRKSTNPICSLAFEADIPFRHIGQGVLRLGQGAHGHKQKSSAFDGDSAIGSALSYDKFLTGKLLRAAGLPAAQHHLVSSNKSAMEAARKLGWPVVVKPVDSEQSRGVTTNIADDKALIGAMELVRKQSKNIIVEKHVPGTCHRIMLSHGELIYVVIRRAKSVQGNGRDTIRQLIAEENAKRMKYPPWARGRPYPLDDLTRKELERHGLTEESVPEDGEYVELRAITSNDWGGSIKDLTEQIHPENVKIARAAAAVVGLTNAGIDFMTTDVSKPWYETGAIINELNYRPGFDTFLREKHAARLMPVMMPHGGRIPVHLVTGTGDVLGKAKALRSALAANGRACFMTAAKYGEDAEGHPIAMTWNSLLERSVALLLQPGVEELVIAGAWPDDFTRGFAVDRFETLHIVSDDPASREQIAREVTERTHIGTPEMAEPAPAKSAETVPAG